jgi:diacylglycerol kinase (ATP)
LKGHGARRLDRAVALLHNAGLDVSLTATTGPGTAGELVRRAIGDGADLILVAGGDGTINETLPGVVDTAVPLAALPAGTANVLALEIGIGEDMVRAAAAFPDLVPMRVSVGRLHASGRAPRYFLLMAGAGVDGDMVHRLNPGLKNRFGKLAYWWSGVEQTVSRFPEFEVRAEESLFRCSLALASRVRKYGGNFEIARRVSLADDHFELVMFEGASVFRYLKYVTGLFSGKLDGMRGITVSNARFVELVPPPAACVHVQVDGEYAGELPARVEIVERALTLLVPQSYAKRGTHGFGCACPDRVDAQPRRR